MSSPPCKFSAFSLDLYAVFTPRSFSLHQNYLSFWLERGAWRLISRYMFGFNQPVVRMAAADNRSPNLNTGGSGTRDSK